MTKITWYPNWSFQPISRRGPNPHSQFHMLYFIWIYCIPWSVVCTGVHDDLSFIVHKFKRCYLLVSLNYLWHMKTSSQQGGSASVEDLDKPRHRLCLIRGLAVCMKKVWVLGFPLTIEWRLRSALTDTQSDLVLPSVYTHFVGFVMSCRFLTHKAPPIICSRRHFQILLLFQK